MRTPSALSNASDNFSRKSEITRQIQGPNSTNLNYKQLTFLVESDIVKGGMFASDQAVFKITTTLQETGEEFIVTRKDDDFYSLRKILLNLFPYTLIPPLPL